MGCERGEDGSARGPMILGRVALRMPDAGSKDANLLVLSRMRPVSVLLRHKRKRGVHLLWCLPQARGWNQRWLLSARESVPGSMSAATISPIAPWPVLRNAGNREGSGESTGRP